MTLQQVLVEIVKELEETIVYVAALETSLVQKGLLQQGEADTYVISQKRQLTNLRSMISRLPAESSL